MRPDRVQSERFEIKYRVTEEKAVALRSYVQRFLAPDDYAAEQPDGSYPVHSIYLDTDDLRLCHATQAGESNRFKLRLRYYDDRPESPLFFEIKHRVNQHIYKYRAQVRRAAAAWLLAGHRPDLQHLVRPDMQQWLDLQQFLRLARRLGVTPRVHVAYRRAAWMSVRDTHARVTLDRAVRCEAHYDASLAIEQQDPAEVFQREQIFELKFQGAMPGWMAEMVRIFELTQGSAAKYVTGVEALGADRLGARGLRLERARPAREEAGRSRIQAGNGTRMGQRLSAQLMRAGVGERWPQVVRVRGCGLSR